MGRRLFVVAVVLLGISLAGSAAAITPPSGIPDLSRMGLQATDFPGSRVARQQYVKPDKPFIASYEREFADLTVRLGPKPLLGLESDVNLARSAVEARSYMGVVALGLAVIDPKDLATAISSGDFKPTYVRLGKIARLRAGDQALELTIRIGTKQGEFRALLVFMRVDRIIDVLLVAGPPRSAIGVPEATTLGRIAARHNREGLAPLNTAPPTVSGTAQVGQTLSASAGTWTNGPTGFSYAWQRCDASAANCVDLGANGQTYVATAADVGSTLRVTVAATNRYGSGKAVSAATATVAGTPTNTAPPVISGTATVGQTLSASTGTWTGNPTSFAYQWQRCDGAGANCVAIAGAAAPTYTVAPEDSGATLRVAVTATNALGSATALSAATPVVS